METCAYCQSVYEVEESSSSIQEALCSMECELEFQKHEESINEYLNSLSE